MPAKTSCAMETKTPTKKRAKPTTVNLPPASWNILEKRYGSKKLWELKPSTVQKIGKKKLKEKYRLAHSRDTCTNTKNISQLANLSRRITNNSATAMIASRNVQRLVEEIKKSGMANEYILKNDDDRQTLERYKKKKKPKAKKPAAASGTAAEAVKVAEAVKKTELAAKQAKKSAAAAAATAAAMAAMASTSPTPTPTPTPNT